MSVTSPVRILHWSQPTKGLGWAFGALVQCIMLVSDVLPVRFSSCNFREMQDETWALPLFGFWGALSAGGGGSPCVLFHQLQLLVQLLVTIIIPFPTVIWIQHVPSSLVILALISRLRGWTKCTGSGV